VKDSQGSRFLRDSLLQFGGTAAGVVLGFAMSICLTRGIAPSDYGLYSLGIGFSATAAALAVLGWDATSIYRLRRQAARGAEVFTLAIVATVAGSLAVIVLVLAARGPIVEVFFPGATQRVLGWALALTVAQVAGMAFMGVALGLDRFALATVYRIVAGVAALSAVIWCLAQDWKGADDALAATAIGYGIAALLLGAAIAWQTGLAVDVRLEALRESVALGWRNWVQLVVTAAHEQAGSWVLAAISRDPAEVAFYALSLGVVNRFRLIPDALGMALFPHTAGLDDRAGAEFTALVLRHTLGWTLGGALMLGFAGPWLLPLVFGPAYVAAVPSFLLLLPTTAASTTFLVVARYFQSIARQGTNIRAQLIGLVVNVTAAIALVGRFGSAGAAMAALASYGILGFLCLGELARTSQTDLLGVLRFRAGEGALYARALRGGGIRRS